MSRCVAGLAVALMLLKMGTWLAVARFSASPSLNAAYVGATLLMLWSYVMAVGVVPASKPPSDGRVRAAESDLDDAPRYCERCDAPKAALVHHCSSCRRCVYRMDHHCPWTNNCVGWDNKKHFLLFLLYTALSCLLFNAIVSALVWRVDSSAAPRSDASLLQLTWALSLLVGIVLTGYLLFHIWLLHRGLTTFEFLMRQRGELADTPLLYNATVYFGSNVALWWLPVAPRLDARMGGASQRETRELLV
ncbi:hypothetical protein PybrP1_007609 [[Pythium] brassicae (nom. inval.)]|nr:hypothetical protein PybrP1_007609 [[Pythium] brassicae (nom. inval.)]